MDGNHCSLLNKKLRGQAVQVPMLPLKLLRVGLETSWQTTLNLSLYPAQWGKCPPLSWGCWEEFIRLCA